MPPTAQTNAAESAVGPASLERVQATVKDFDRRTRSGSVLLDDGQEIPFGAAAFDAGGLRLLRLGQRVRLERDEAGTITLITIATLF